MARLCRNIDSAHIQLQSENRTSYIRKHRVIQQDHSRIAQETHNITNLAHKARSYF